MDTMPKGVNRIRALPDIAEKTFNGVGAANVAMHDRRKSIKRQLAGNHFLTITSGQEQLREMGGPFCGDTQDLVFEAL